MIVERITLPFSSIFNSNSLHLFKPYKQWVCFDSISGTIINLEQKEAEIVKALLDGSFQQKDIENYKEFINTFKEVISKNRGKVKHEGLPERYRLMVLMISQYCNMQCSYCYAGEGTYGMPSFMDSEIGKISLDVANKLNIPNIQFYGGEPLLNFKLIKKLITYAESRGYEFSYGLVTNGTLITDEVADFLKHHDFEVTVSLDGPPKVHNECRRFKGGQGSHNHVIRGIEKLNKRGVKLAIELTYSKKHKGKASIDEILDYITRFSKVFIAGYVTPAELSPSSLIETPSGKELIELMISVCDYVFDKVSKGIPIKEFSIYNVVRYLLSPTKTQRQLICRDAASRITVFSNGDVYPCCQLTGKKFYLGNVKKSDFVNNFHKRKKKVLRNFSINLLKDYWFKNLSDFCAAHLTYDGTYYSLREEEAYSKFFEYVIYRFITSDVEKIVDVWGGRLE